MERGEKEEEGGKRRKGGNMKMGSKNRREEGCRGRRRRVK